MRPVTRRAHGVSLARMALLVGIACSALPATVRGQSQSTVDRERMEFQRWLATSPVSPFRAVAQVPLAGGVSLGPEGSDVPLAGVPRHVATEAAGKLALQGPSGPRALPRGRPVSLGAYTVTASGVAGRSVLTVFQPGKPGRDVTYFPYDTMLSFIVRLEPPATPGRVRLLAADGVEVEAAEAGTVTVLLGRSPIALTVRRIPNGPDESELEIYFRDKTNGATTYPSGRFVSLVPLREQTYRLDFNRARNPYCAYSSAYACPAPWPGNTLGMPVEAGERYEKSPATP